MRAVHFRDNDQAIAEIRAELEAPAERGGLTTHALSLAARQFSEPARSQM